MASVDLPFVPVLDYSQSDEELVDHLHAALSTVGFACLKNTDVWSQVERWAEHCKEFFYLPEEKKMRYIRPNNENGGWVNRERERLSANRPGDLKECFNAMPYITNSPDRYPPEMHAEECKQLFTDLTAVTNRILRLIAMGLKLEDREKLVKTHKDMDCCSNRNNQSTLRINFYPQVSESEVKPDQARCGEHSDYGSITLVYSDSPGLEVFNRQTGEYQSAGDPEGILFLNVGDLLAMWSADALKSTLHRVMVPESANHGDRVSVAFFVQPDDDTLIESLDGSNKYPSVTSKGWLMERFAATYNSIEQTITK